MTMTTPMSSEKVEQVEGLTKCPFCGSTDSFVERTDFSSCHVVCNDCGARGPSSCDENEADADASEAGDCEPGEMPARRLWNRRALPQAQAAVDVERIGDLRLDDEPNDDGDRLCNEGHSIPVGAALYWPANPISQYDDDDPHCFEHAVERALDRGEISRAEAAAIQSAALPPVIAESAGGGERDLDEAFLADARELADLREHHAYQLAYWQTSIDRERAELRNCTTEEQDAPHQHLLSEYQRFYDFHQSALQAPGIGSSVFQGIINRSVEMIREAEALHPASVPATLATPSPIAEAVEAWRPIEAAEMWQVAIVTDGENVALAQKAEADYGGHYWSIDPEDALEWEPTHWIEPPTLRASKEPGA